MLAPGELTESSLGDGPIGARTAVSLFPGNRRARTAEARGRALEELGHGPSPDFSDFSEEEIDALLPRHLRGQMRLCRTYVRLMEVARRLPAATQQAMMQTFRRSRMPGARRSVSALDAVFDLLVVAMANCSDESFLTEFFHELIGPFDALPAREKERFLCDVDAVICLSTA